MREAGRYHSALHEPDNRHHIYSECPHGSNIKMRCLCDESPVKLRQWCDKGAAHTAARLHGDAP